MDLLIRWFRFAEPSCEHLVFGTRGANRLRERCVMTALEIVWRNPKPHQHRQRRQLLGRESGAAVNVIQEFVFSMVGGFWSPTASLEVLSGGRAA
jgi:hypothetical protein